MGIYDYQDHYTLKRNRLVKLEQVNNKCEKCGGQAKITHHIDRSRNNHNISNLQALCHKCHRKIHPYKGQGYNIKSRICNGIIKKYIIKIKYRKVERIRISRKLGYMQLAKEIGMSMTGIRNILLGLTTPWETTEYKIDLWLAKWEWIL